MAVVTIAGQLGSSSHLVAEQVSRALGWRLIRREDLQRAARERGLPASAVNEMAAEGRATLVDELLGALQVLPRFPGGWDVPAAHAPRMAEEQSGQYREIVHTLTAVGNCVLPGGGGALILRERSDARHALIIAPLRLRMESLMQSEGLDREGALERIRLGEEQAQHFARRYYSGDWQDSSLYDLIINRRTFSVESAARLIERAAREIHDITGIQHPQP